MLWETIFLEACDRKYNLTLELNVVELEPQPGVARAEMEPSSSSSLDSSHGLQIRILVCCYGLISQKASHNRLVTKL